MSFSSSLASAGSPCTSRRLARDFRGEAPKPSPWPAPSHGSAAGPVPPRLGARGRPTSPRPRGACAPRPAPAKERCPCAAWGSALPSAAAGAPQAPLGARAAAATESMESSDGRWPTCASGRTPSPSLSRGMRYQSQLEGSQAAPRRRNLTYPLERLAPGSSMASGMRCSVAAGSPKKPQTVTTSLARRGSSTARATYVRRYTASRAATPAVCSAKRPHAAALQSREMA
mmetsp:Transcript_87291/g.275689  ORF Transcript_87291/g.275689 Transcript_87291/m.275689 type:complete len:229 (-) Transcript_87291:175-861(-)